MPLLRATAPLSSVPRPHTEAMCDGWCPAASLSNSQATPKPSLPPLSVTQHRDTPRPCACSLLTCSLLPGL